MKEQTDRTKILIIGGGCVGLSIAFYLARMGQDGVTLVEREPFTGSCSTGLGAGGIRCQFATEINVRLSLESSAVFSNFEEETGARLDFKKIGYLFLAADDKTFARYKRNVVLQRSLGAQSKILSADEVKSKWPHIETSGLFGASFCAEDGIADPHTVAQGYASAARKLGVEIFENTAVEGFEVVGHKVTGVRTRGGTVQAKKIVIAAGAWSGALASLAGADIPVAPLRRVCFVTDTLAGIPPDCPFTIDSGSGFWLRGEGSGALMGVPGASDAPGSFDTSVDWSLREKVVEAGLKRMPALSGAAIKKAWAGLYEMTPDNHPIIGEIDGIDGLYAATGFSGHGFMHSPAAGLNAAELIATGSTSLDISSLSPGRFKEGKLIKEDIWI